MYMFFVLLAFLQLLGVSWVLVFIIVTDNRNRLSFFLSFIKFACLFSKERKKKGVRLGGWGCEVKEREETMIRIYCMKNSVFK